MDLSSHISNSGGASAFLDFFGFLLHLYNPEVNPYDKKDQTEVFA
jgi:hypothetical protein